MSYETDGEVKGATGYFGGASHYASFEADGTLKMTGDATVWDDLRFPATSVKVPPAKYPGFSQFLDDGASSQGVFLLWFDATTEEEVYIIAQLPHGYKEGSDVYPHVHWTPAAGGGAGEVASWGMEYTWANIGGDFGATSIIYANAHTPADASLVASRHYWTSFAALTGTNKTISSMLAIRLFRDAAGTGETDSYGGDAGLLEFDVHFEMDTIGSRLVSAK